MFRDGVFRIQSGLDEVIKMAILMMGFVFFISPFLSGMWGTVRRETPTSKKTVMTRNRPQCRSRLYPLELLEIKFCGLRQQSLVFWHSSLSHFKTPSKLKQADTTTVHYNLNTITTVESLLFTSKKIPFDSSPNHFHFLMYYITQNSLFLLWSINMSNPVQNKPFLAESWWGHCLR